MEATISQLCCHNRLENARIVPGCVDAGGSTTCSGAGKRINTQQEYYTMIVTRSMTIDPARIRPVSILPFGAISSFTTLTPTQ
jgi:hypothetical protein